MAEFEWINCGNAAGGVDRCDEARSRWWKAKGWSATEAAVGRKAVLCRVAEPSEASADGGRVELAGKRRRG